MATKAAGIFLAAMAPVTVAAADTGAVELFETKIRPVLAVKCAACHGAANPQSGLRVDSREALVKGGSRGTAIVEGDPEASLLFRAITHADGAPAMPQGSRLNGTEIEAFREWIRLGAPYPAGTTSPTYTSGVDFVKGRQFWAFQPVKDPPVPTVRRQAWVRSPIDAFLLSSLEKRGLAPASETDRRKLIRRVTFDLTGLPPSPIEVADFLADRSPSAFEKVVKRLLESPHYGERWGRHWLDLARFAETSGHEFDSEKPDAWRYRDYVIRAFNEDLPYDQFVRENIAGDLIPRPRLAASGTRWESQVGSGFFSLHEERNAADDLAEVQSEKIDNQIDVLTKTFLGLTVACARCHDHKFDPIASADYYALAGVMHSTRQTEMSLDSPAANAEIEAIHARIRTANQRLAQVLSPARAQPVSQLSGRLLQPTADWKAVLERAAKDPGDVFYALAVLSQPSDQPFRERVTALRAQLAEMSARTQARGDVLFADFRDGSYEGWEVNGTAFGSQPVQVVSANQAVSGWRGGGLANSFGGGSNALTGVLTSRSFIVDKPFLHVRMAGIPDKSRRREHGVLRFTLQVAGRPAFVNADKEGVFEWKTVRLTQQQGQRCYFVIADRSTDGYLAVEKIVLSETREPPPLDRPLNRYVAAILNGADIESLESLGAAYGRAFEEALRAQRQDPDTQWLLASLSPSGRLEDLAGLLDEAGRTEVEALKGARAAAESKIPLANYGVVSRDDYPHDVPLLVRGHLANPGPIIPRRFLQVLAGDSGEKFTLGSGRSELAETIASPQNPLTARVMVNRIWKHHFGEGIVRSPDNLGMTGARPTHPDLLDYLAQRFVKSGWSVKAVHRLIVLSSAYRMSSQPVPASAKADPENTLLHHFPVRRLEAEELRDSILAVAGNLDRTLYGPGVPPHISPYQDGRGKPPTGPLDGNGRRSIYLQVRRNFLTPLLLAFDYPLPTTTIGKRTTTTVPSQALMLMNNEFVYQQATRWAERITADTETPTAKIARMFDEAYSRPASVKEIDNVRSFLAAQTELNGGDVAKAWADVAHVLMNSKEFLFVR